VYAIDAVHVWAVGDNNFVYRRDAGGWVSIGGPGAPQTTLTSVWAASDADVYVGSSGVSSLYHTVTRGQSWNSIDAKLSAGVTGIAGLDANNVFVADSLGEISLGSAAQGFLNDRSSDGTAFAGLDVFAGNVFAARGGQVLLRNATATPKWSAILDVSTAAQLNATWGSTTTDLYAVGVQQPCSTNCGVLEHKVGTAMPTSMSITNCTAFYDVWGEANGNGGFTVYAVGSFGTLVTTPNQDSWSQLPSPTSAALYGVHGTDGEIYVVGGAGTILHIVE
jgi:hypothetical protein